MKPKTLAQGAEAIIIKNDKEVIKKRERKSYRIPELDNKIRKLRTRSEKKLIEKSNKIINVPELLTARGGGRGRGGKDNLHQIKMQHIPGKKLSDYLNKFPLTKQKQICKQIGQSIAKLHNENIIHGDLTTSNMILSKDKIFFIDFGLGFISHKIEDKAVDLHLLKQALEAKHFQNWEVLFKEVIKGYSKSSKGGIQKGWALEAKKVLNQLNKVEKRGRYKG